LSKKEVVDSLKVLILDGLKTLNEYLLISKNVRIKFVTCGRDNCRCRLGKRHGPYYYIRKKVNGTYKDIYVKPPKEVPSFSYELVGSSMLLDVKNINQVPEFLKSLPTFVVQKRIS